MKLIITLALILQHYLLMLPIENAIKSNDFSRFHLICNNKLLVNIEKPFNFNGYVNSEKFISEFSLAFSRYEPGEIEWTSIVIERDFAIQSLNLVLKDRRTKKVFLYKFIFYTTKEKEWKLYFLRGLRI